MTLMRGSSFNHLNKLFHLLWKYKYKSLSFIIYLIFYNAIYPLKHFIFYLCNDDENDCVMEHNIVHNECNMKLIVGGEGSVRIPSLIDQISKRSKGAVFFLLFAICTTFRSYWPFLPNIPNIQKIKRCYLLLTTSVNIVDKGKLSPSDQINHIYSKIQISWHLSPYLSECTLPTREIITGITWSYWGQGMLGRVRIPIHISWSYRDDPPIISRTRNSFQPQCYSGQVPLSPIVMSFPHLNFSAMELLQNFNLQSIVLLCIQGQRILNPRYEILLVNYNSICWCKLWWSALWGLMHPSKKNWTSSNYLTMSSIYVFQSAGSPLCEYAHQYKEGIYICSDSEYYA